jgi:hypothetical protein
MNRLYCIAVTLAVGMTTSGAFAQGTPAGAAAAPAGAAPATTAAPTTTTTAPATTTTAPADKPAATTTDDKSKKKTAAKKGSKSELQRSIDAGTVPSRYKSQIPAEYHDSIRWGR